jgi:nicotinate-nucleotide adenylyltransferase
MIRVAVADAATCDDQVRWEVSDLELRRDGPSYTYDTLSALHAEGLSALQIFFIIGADAFSEIATWYRYPEVLDFANFAVVARPGMTNDMLRNAQSTEPRVVLIDANTPDVSSTDIRHRAARGESLTGLVPSPIAAYIAHHLLYRDAPEAPTAPRPFGPPDAAVGK